jgi:hypothetical protein
VHGDLEGCRYESVQIIRVSPEYSLGAQSTCSCTALHAWDSSMYSCVRQWFRLRRIVTFGNEGLDHSVTEKMYLYHYLRWIINLMEVLLCPK